MKTHVKTILVMLVLTVLIILGLHYPERANTILLVLLGLALAVFLYLVIYTVIEDFFE
jgi:hypothetical protein